MSVEPREPFYRLLAEQGTIQIAASVRLLVGEFADARGGRYVGVVRQKDREGTGDYESGKGTYVPIGHAPELARLIAAAGAF
jgi:hypothetical protein